MTTPTQLSPAHELSSHLRATLARLEADPDYTHLREIPGVAIDLKYATEDNFMNRNVYGEFREAFLHRVAAEKLRRASELLRAEFPRYRFIVYDALRPRSVQRLLWAHVEGTPEQDYVANPDKGSMHNYGFAIDLSILDGAGRPLDMGAGFDEFHPRSQPKLEDHYLASGELKPAQHRNRLILRHAMTGAGFLQLSHEWWHYDALPGDQVRANYVIIE